jgi:hypothetical protein
MVGGIDGLQESCENTSRAPASCRSREGLPLSIGVVEYDGNVGSSAGGVAGVADRIVSPSTTSD